MVKIKLQKIVQSLAMTMLLGGLTLTSNAQLITIGTGAVSQATNGLCPYNTLYHDARIQYLILASEMASGGVTSAGNISNLSFNCNTLPGMAMSGYTIKLGHTTQTDITGGYVNNSTFTTCYSALSFMPIIGWNLHSFTTPFMYNGSDNIIVEICYDNIDWTGGGSVLATTTTFGSVYGTRMDGGAGCSNTSLTTVFTSMDRPNMQLTWTPSSPAATIPPIASFAYSKTPMDTVWIGAPRTMVNTSSGADKSYWDILGYNGVTKNGPYIAFPETRTPKISQGINDVFIDTINNAVNFRYIYPNAGFYRVKVTAVNKF